MAISAYTKTTWVNGGAPAISAANLQNIEDQVKAVTDAAVSGGASPTKLWSDTNDGNGGQPPAPKPNTNTWKFQALSTTTGNNCNLPGSGSETYAYFAWRMSTISGTWDASVPVMGYGAGGATVSSGVADYYYLGFAWRVA